MNLSNAGNYTCSYFLSNNSFVQSSGIKSTTVTLIIKSEIIIIIHSKLYLLDLVPSSTNEFVDLNPSQSYYEVGSSVMLTCSIPISHYIDTNVIIYIQWNNNNTQSISIKSNIKEFNHSITLNQLKLSDAGEYNCTYYFTSANDSRFIISSFRNTVTSNINLKSKCIYL